MNAGFITEQKGAMTHVITTFWDISTSKCVLVSIVDRHRHVSFHSYKSVYIRYDQDFPNIFILKSKNVTQYYFLII